MEKVAYVQCKFSRGAFPTENIFRIVAPAASKGYYGAAPLQYCLNLDRTPLTTLPDDGEVDGLVVGVTIQKQIQNQGSLVRVYLPDGEVYDVSRDQVDYPETPRVPQRT